MRLGLLCALLMLGAVPLPSHAAPVSMGELTVGPSSNIVQVDRRCGRGRHYVPRHRNRAGHIVHGRCVYNHR
jgi:hypothetical protein